MTETDNHPAAAYVAFYEALSPDTVGHLNAVAHDDIRFKDPFSDVRGVGAYKALLEAMFRSAPNIRFKVTHCAYDGDICFLRWACTGSVKRLGSEPWHVEGMTELTFADDGRVLSHIDFWDASTQFYNRIPVIRSLIRFIQRRVAQH